MKKFLALLLAVVMLLSFAACAKKDDAKKDDAKGDAYRVAILNKQDTNEYICNLCNKIQAHFDADDSMSVVRYDADGDSSAQLQQFEDVLNEGIDFIVVVPMDAETLTSAVKDANEMGVPVVAADITLIPDSCDFMFVGSNNYQLAYAQGEWLAKNLVENGRILLMRFTPGSETSNNRYQGLVDALADSGRTDYEILQVLEFNATQEDAQSKVEDALQVYGDEFDCYVVPADAGIYGGIAAMEGAGIDVASKLLVGFDAEDACVKLIDEGKVDMSLKQGQDQLAQTVYDLAVLYQGGGAVKEGEEIIYIPGTPVDSTNVKDFLK